MPSTSSLLLGAEAVAFGALDAGISGAFSYAGTPATEIFETVQAEAGDVWAVWSANEKVAYEEALGVSYTGRRALVSMKHVGLNVAADPFMSSALTGANGGLVVVVADDPGMHSSQNEQDSRFYADFAHVPCFEPANQQECYSLTREAFEFSETHRIPVMIRLVTRIAHSRANVRRVSPEDRLTNAGVPTRPDPNDWTLLPANARRRYRRLLDLQRAIANALEGSTVNRFRPGGRRGVLSAGIATNYVEEADPGSADTRLHVGAYPLPGRLIREFVDRCDEILVVEEGSPFIESRVLGLLGVPGKVVRGKLDGSLPLDGELVPETVARAMGIQVPESQPDAMVAGRPPQFCKGCPHGSSFGALVDATAPYPDALIFGDIGCYALGIMPPYRAIHACVDMGASIGLAHGASRAGAHPVLCTIGDSTFAHSGLPALLDVVHSDANVTILILDNGTTAMTGAQDSHATGDVLLAMLRGLGVTDLTVFDPLPKHHTDNVRLIREAIERPGPSVLVAKRACVRIKLGKHVTPLPVSGP